MAPDVTPSRDIGKRPELAFVPVAAIGVDSNYQRELRDNLVKRILKNFSWAKFGAVVLSRQADGSYMVVEGQHRWKAASLHPDVTEIPAVIVEHDGVASEADSFIAINRDRQAVTSVEQYWAGLTAGDGRAVAIDRVVKAADCDIAPAAGVVKPHLTNAVTAIERAIARYGEGATRRALIVIRRAWPQEAKALRGTLITALARVIRANEKTVSDAELSGAIRDQSIAKLTAHAEGFRKLSGGSAETALARTIVELHNRGKRTNVLYFGSGA